MKEKHLRRIIVVTAAQKDAANAAINAAMGGSGDNFKTPCSQGSSKKTTHFLCDIALPYWFEPKLKKLLTNAVDIENAGKLGTADRVKSVTTKANLKVTDKVEKEDPKPEQIK